MSRQRGTYGQLGRFLIADLPDAYHIRVLPEDISQGLGESNVGLRVYLNLACLRQNGFFVNGRLSSTKT